MRRAGDTVRVNAQLIDATTGGHVWAAGEPLSSAYRSPSLCATVGFFAPRILSIMACVTEDPIKRAEVLKDGEAMLETETLGHNHLWFYRYAIEACLGAGDWQGALRDAAKLEDFTRLYSM